MTSIRQETSQQLSRDELAVAAVLEAIADVTNEDAVRRTMLLAIIDAAHERPALLNSDVLGSLDREQVSDALLALRAMHLATLDEAGFRLTEQGVTTVKKVISAGPISKVFEELKRLVGTKLSEWSIAI